MSERVPEGWKLDRLGSLCSSIRGVSYRPENLHSTKSKHTATLLRSNNIQEIGLNFKDVQYVDIHKVKSKQIAIEGDIAVCMSNGSKRLVGKNSPFAAVWGSETFTVGAFCSIIRTNENSTHKFVKHLLKSNAFTRQVEFSLAGSAINNLKDGDVENYTFRIPPIPEQKKIASILTSVDEVIEKTQSQINKLQDLKKGTMNELLTRGIGHIEFKDSELGKIPKGWEISDLKSLVVSHNSGIYKKKSEYGNGYNILGVSDLYSCHIVDGQIFRKVPLTDEEVLEFSLKKGDLVYGESSLVREGIAKTVCVSENGEGTIFAWHTRRFSVSDNMDSIFLNYFLSSNISRTYLTKVATQTALTGITTKDYFGVKVVIPSFKEQQQIVTILSSIDNHIEKKQRKLQKNQYLKKSLMQDLLTGKVRVSVN
jgi:type I restriction enzyme S subunit